MQSIIEKYLSVNPRRLNPFNAEHHDFVPSDDAAADADYLARVAGGETSRFYVTLSELALRPGRYEAVVKDGHNGNVLAGVVPAPLGKAAAYAAPIDHLIAGVDTCVRTAARLGIDFRPDMALVQSGLGYDHAQLLQRYAAGDDGDAATEWVSWTAQPAADVSWNSEEVL